MQKEKSTKFVVPYVDQGKKFWEKLSEFYGSHIKAVYFPLMDDSIGTGRPRQPDIHLVEFLESRILPVSVLVNPVVLPHQVEDVADRLLEKLEYFRANFDLVEITLTNQMLARKIKEYFPGLSIAASTLMEIYNEQQLSMMDDVFDTLVPSSRILRDIKTLTKLRAGFKGKMRLLVNESCLSSCIYRTQHFYEMSNPAISLPGSLCNELLAQKPWLKLTGGWILPQHLHLFEDIYDEIKLAGRISLQNPKNYFRVLESYINETPLQPHEIGGGPAAINFPMEIETSFYKSTLDCDKNCIKCSICSDYWTEKARDDE